jgi:hypothetical protein
VERKREVMQSIRREIELLDGQKVEMEREVQNEQQRLGEGDGEQQLLLEIKHDERMKEKMQTRGFKLMCDASLLFDRVIHLIH